MGMAAANRIFQILDTPPKIQEAGDWEKLDAAFAKWRRARGV